MSASWFDDPFYKDEKIDTRSLELVRVPSSSRCIIQKSTTKQILEGFTIERQFTYNPANSMKAAIETRRMGDQFVTITAQFEGGKIVMQSTKSSVPDAQIPQFLTDWNTKVEKSTASKPTPAPSKLRGSRNAHNAMTMKPGSGEVIKGTKEDELFCLKIMNEARAKEGLPPLIYSDNLKDIAMPHTIAMLRKQVDLGHDGADKRFGQIKDSTRQGENVGFNAHVPNPVQSMSDSWLRSVMHRKNIMGQFNTFGVAFAHDDFGAWYGTQLFAFLPANAPASKARVLTIKEETRILDEINKVRHSKGLRKFDMNPTVHEIGQDEMINMATGKEKFGTQNFKQRSTQIFDTGKSGYNEKLGKRGFSGTFDLSFAELIKHLLSAYAQVIISPEYTELGMAIAYLDGTYTFLLGFIK